MRHELKNLRRSSRKRRIAPSCEEDGDGVLEEEQEKEEMNVELEGREKQRDNPNNSSHNSITKKVFNDQKQNLWSKLQCPVCRNILSDPYMILNCCHRFCGKCIMNSNSVIIQKIDCPTCLESIRSKKNFVHDDMFGKLVTRMHTLQSEINLEKKERSTETQLKETDSESQDLIDGQHSDGNEAIQSSDHKKDSLSPKKKRKLDDDKLQHQKKKQKCPGFTFDEHFRELQKYKEIHGDCKVPFRYQENRALGNWCVQIRRIKAGKFRQWTSPDKMLTEERIQQLDNIGFEWDPHSQTFNNYLDQLKAFKNIHGHCDVKSTCKDNPTLAHFCNAIRRAYKYFKAGKKAPSLLGITPSKIEQLEEIGFRWRIDPYKKVKADINVLTKKAPGRKMQSSFGKNLRKLEEFKAVHGHCNVPHNYKDQSLYMWCKDMRHAYTCIQVGTKPRRRLTQSMIEQLDKIGFRWRIQNFTQMEAVNDALGTETMGETQDFIVKGSSFDRNMIKLKEFKATYGHCDVPFRYKADPSLRSWCDVIRRNYKAMQRGEKSKNRSCCLTKQMIEQMEDIGFRWQTKKLSNSEAKSKMIKITDVVPV